MAIGFIAGKVNVISITGNKNFSKIILYITLPCTILNSVIQNDIEITGGDTAYFFLMSLLTFLIAFVVSLPIMYLMGGDKANRGLLSFMAIFSNCGFMGFPVAIAIFGLSSAYFATLFNIPFNLLVFSIGVIMIAGKKPVDDNQITEPDENQNNELGNRNKKLSTKNKFNPKQFLSPTLIVAIIVIPIALLDIKFPAIITEAVGIVSYITSPGAMIVIGVSLAHIPIKSIFAEWRIIPVILLKLLIIPAVTWLILKQIISDEFILGILVVLSAMPTAALASMIAIEYNGNERLASAGVIITTILCGVTVPLIIYLFLM